MKRLILSEVLDQLANTSNRIEGAELLQKYAGNKEVRWFCYMAFNPDAPKFPFKKIDYTPKQTAIGFNHMWLHHCLDPLNMITSGVLRERKAYNRLRLILEELHSTEAELLHMLITGKVKVPRLSYDVVHRAFPDLVFEKVKKSVAPSSEI
jgi:hypothetical protein